MDATSRLDQHHQDAAPTPPPDPGPARRTLAPVLGAAAADVASVLVFAAAGRRSHHDSTGLVATLGTAWPFLVGLLVGWVLARAWRAPAAISTALVVWPVTVTVAMGLRWASGQGTATAFVLVATAVTAALLVGWRVLARVLARVSRR